MATERDLSPPTADLLRRFCAGLQAPRRNAPHRRRGGCPQGLGPPVTCPHSFRINDAWGHNRSGTTCQPHKQVRRRRYGFGFVFHPQPPAAQPPTPPRPLVFRRGAARAVACLVSHGPQRFDFLQLIQLVVPAVLVLGFEPCRRVAVEAAGAEAGANREGAVEAPAPAESAAVRAPRTSVPTLSAARAEGVAAAAIAAVPRRQAPPREGATSSPHIRQTGPGEVATLAWLRGAGSRYRRRRRRLRRLRP